MDEVDGGEWGGVGESVVEGGEDEQLHLTDDGWGVEVERVGRQGDERRVV